MCGRSEVQISGWLNLTQHCTASTSTQVAMLSWHYDAEMGTSNSLQALLYFGKYNKRFVFAQCETWVTWVGSTSFWRDYFVVALFGVFHFVAGPFWRKFQENNFFFFKLSKNFFVFFHFFSFAFLFF